MTAENSPPDDSTQHYREALSAVERTLERFQDCTAEEKSQLRSELAGLREMQDKLSSGRVSIVIFGEISTGKSALINALAGETITSVDVQGGWTKEIQSAAWQDAGYVLPGVGDSHVRLIDTPGINEVGGEERARIAREAAQQADILLMVVDSDLNDIEHAALLELAAMHKPIIVVLNKIDLYTPSQRERLLTVLRQERMADLPSTIQLVTAAADPREKEYIIQSADGSERSEWRKPLPDVMDLKEKILQILDKEGLALVALGAALYASDKSDRIAKLRLELRDRRAKQVIWSSATVKAIAVGLNPAAFLDVIGGVGVDIGMVMTLAQVYGYSLTWNKSRELVTEIGKAAGFMTLGVMATSFLTSTLKAFSIGKSTLVTALPQGAAAGYGSYIVGEAAKYYFEHGSSFGKDGPKVVVQRILDTTDKESIVTQLRTEILRKLGQNFHSKK